MLEAVKERRFFALLLIIAVVDLWLIPIRSSFWLDETATFWIIKDGPANLLARSLNWAGQSPLYYLIDWLAFRVGGRQEWILRLPSFLALLAGTGLYYRLAVRLFDSATARLAVLAFVCSEPVVFAASDARPYAFGLLALIGSAWTLVKWLDSGLGRYAVWHVLLTTLVIYTHYLFAPALLVLGVYSLFRAREESKVRIRKLAGAWAAVGVMALPLGSQLLHFFSSRKAHSFAGTPGASDLLEALAPPVLAASIIIAVFLAWVFFPRRFHSCFAAPRESLRLAVAWAVVPPVLLFVVSVCSATKVFVPRYYIGYVPGLALIAGWLGSSAVIGSGRRIVSAILVGASILSFGSLSHGQEDWAGVMRKIRSTPGLKSVPVLAASGFVEATDPEALDDPQLREVLFAPQEMYPPSGPLVRLPYRLDEKSAKYVDRVLAGMEQQNRFVLLVRYQGLMFQPWIYGRLAPYGFRTESLGNFGNLGASLFTRVEAAHNGTSPR